ncbi:hypothetical protein V8C86DRAFT_2585800, partial [Haematococcus lacustris]
LRRLVVLAEMSCLCLCVVKAMVQLCFELCYARKAGCSLAGLVTTSSLPLAGVDKLSKASTTAGVSTQQAPRKRD